MNSANSQEDNKLLKYYLNFLPESKQFTFFGDKIINIDNHDIHFEVFYRYSMKDSEIEMMFKDVTRSKINEQKFQILNTKQFSFRKLLMNLKILL
jgi:hypothetical protein